MQALFVMTTMDAWPDQMFAAIDSTGVEKQPVIGHSTVRAAFFYLFLMGSSGMYARTHARTHAYVHTHVRMFLSPSSSWARQ